MRRRRARRGVRAQGFGASASWMAVGAAVALRSLYATLPTASQKMNYQDAIHLEIRCITPEPSHGPCRARDFPHRRRNRRHHPRGRAAAPGAVQRHHPHPPAGAVAGRRAVRARRAAHGADAVGADLVRLRLPHPDPDRRGAPGGVAGAPARAAAHCVDGKHCRQPPAAGAGRVSPGLARGAAGTGDAGHAPGLRCAGALRGGLRLCRRTAGRPGAARGAGVRGRAGGDHARAPPPGARRGGPGSADAAGVRTGLQLPRTARDLVRHRRGADAARAAAQLLPCDRRLRRGGHRRGDRAALGAGPVPRPAGDPPAQPGRGGPGAHAAGLAAVDGQCRAACTGRGPARALTRISGLSRPRAGRGLSGRPRHRRAACKMCPVAYT
ncbi:exported hypothetical protein [Cupriavidus taiwanensis]|uniref:Uncharacterized protein n=1 Tax=Cupriavidus taiwanensis TaxID=164546 RepID=A0A975WYF6_9BURK|nr:exported hypothetical protein [Cupriavidus taiwanensis]